MWKIYWTFLYELVYCQFLQISHVFLGRIFLSLFAGHNFTYKQKHTTCIFQTDLLISFLVSNSQRDVKISTYTCCWFTYCCSSLSFCFIYAKDILLATNIFTTMLNLCILYDVLAMNSILSEIKFITPMFLVHIDLVILFPTFVYNFVIIVFRYLWTTNLRSSSCL